MRVNVGNGNFDTLANYLTKQGKSECTKLSTLIEYSKSNVVSVVIELLRRNDARESVVNEFAFKYS